MKLLLDTHALLWWLADDAKLSAPACAAIADPANEILVSAVSLWEIAVKSRIGKLTANMDEILTAIATGGFTRLPITDAHLQTLMALPTHHRDPFDHLLIAQALAENAIFCTADDMASRYEVAVLA